MRWPFRRRTTPVTGRSRAEIPPARPNRDPVPPRAPGPVPSRPRFDWANLPAIQRTVDVRPPLTFHGDRFGRSVAGARAIDAATRPRSHRRDTAPSGVMLDVAKVETIEPAPDRPQPAMPPVHPDPIRGQRSRHVSPVHRVTPTRDLTTADVAVDFEPAPERERPIPTTVSWTADRGFVEDRSDESGSDDDVEGAASPQLRYVPTTEQRHERAPRDLVDLVQQATGVDVGDAVIDRSPAVSDRADELGAVAFTERGTVHLPAELGDLGEPGVRGVVAHELTHVAQQRARRSEPPAEDSSDGRELEAEARAVQRAAGGPVRPRVMRRRAHAPRSQAGVQRLAADESEDRRFAWQDRDEEHSPSQTRSALGLFGGYSWSEDSGGGRALQREDDQWRRDFEREHRDDLLDRRQEHYQEIVERRLELKRARAPEDEREHVALGRRDVIGAREQLDRDMPFEFELPASVDPYPGDLPEAGPDDEEEPLSDREPDDGASSSAGPSRPSSVRRAPVSAASGGVAAAFGRTGTRTAAGFRRPGGAIGSGSATSEPGFDWQRREPTDQQAVTALFGGGLFGDLLSRAVGEETDDDRRAAEAERLVELNTQRQRREGELRHRKLQDKLRVSQTEARREERDAPTAAISLTDAEITEIREQIDTDMPLEFAVPTYLDAETGITIDAAGQIIDGRPEPVAETPSEAATGEQSAAETETAPTEATDDDASATPAATDGTTTTEAAETTTATAGDVAEPESGDTGVGPPRGRTTAGSLMTAATLAQTAGDVIGDDDAEPDSGEAAATVLSSASEYDIDVLSRRIWSRIRREMRSELLVDRERAGALADLR